MSETFVASKAALVLIDFQVGTMQLIKTIPVQRAWTNGLALAKAAKILGMPVSLTSSQEDRVQGPLIPELDEIQPEAFARRIERAGIVNARDDPNFRAAVEATGRRQLVMAGVTTDVCLVYPTISAIRDGSAVQAVGCLGFAVRAVRGHVAPPHGDRRRGPHGDEHDHRRTRDGLVNRGGIATDPAPVREHPAAGRRGRVEKGRDRRRVRHVIVRRRAAAAPLRATMQRRSVRASCTTREADEL